MESLSPFVCLIVDADSIDLRFTRDEDPEFVDAKIMGFWPESIPLSERRYHAMLIQGVASFLT